MQFNVVYKIQVKEKPGDASKPEKKERQRNSKNYTKGSNFANHVWQNNHSIDFDNACLIDKDNFHAWKTLESWHMHSQNCRLGQ